MRIVAKVSMCIFITFFALPILCMICVSFMSVNDATALLGGKKIVSVALTLTQYKEAVLSNSFLLSFRNSAIITLYSLVLNIPVSLCAGLMLSRSRNRWRKLLIVLYVVAMLLPFQIIMLPVYELSLWSGLYDSYTAVVILNAFAPMGAVMVSVLIGTIHESQWEAAKLETNSAFSILWHILLPQMLPGVVALSILVFAQVWNMVEQPLLLIPDGRLKPLSLSFNDIVSASSNYTYAGAVLYATPIIVLYIIVIMLARKHSYVFGAVVDLM